MVSHFWRNNLRMCKVILPLLLLSTSAHSTTRHVPLEYTDIQLAINAATAGDTILVSPGTYTGPIDINKSLAVIGSWPGSLTVIEAPSDFATNSAYDRALTGFVPCRTIVHVGSTSSIAVTLRGFIVDGLRLGPAIDQQVGYSGVLAEECSFTMTGCMVRNILPTDSAGSTWEPNKQYNGRGVEVRGSGSTSLISGNTFQEINRFHILINASDDSGSYVPLVFPMATISQDTIIGKGVYNGGQKGIWFNSGAYGTITQNDISNLDFHNAAIEPERSSCIVIWQGDINPTGVTTISKNVLTASTFTNNKGIYAWGVRDIITENTVTGFRWGVELHNQQYPFMARNTITGGMIGVMVVDEVAGRSDTITIGGSPENKNVISGQISPAAGGRAIALTFRDPVYDTENLSSPIAVNAKYNDFGVYTSSEIRARIFCRGDTTIPEPYLLDTVLFSPFAVPKPTLAIKAYLQGPFSVANDSMSCALNTAGVLSVQFAGKPIPSAAVDSIGIEVRDALTTGTSTKVHTVPAWLLGNGTIRSMLDTTKNYVELPDSVSGEYYVVVRHRNHLAIMSSTLVLCEGGATPAAYDFTTAQDKAYTTGANPMQAVGSHFAMTSGDANGNGQVTNSDVNTWIRPKIGLSGYLGGDANLNGQVANSDMNNYARPNIGKGTQVP